MYEDDKMSALQAINQAQYIAFAPVIFQATVALRDLGVLSCIDEANEQGIEIREIVKVTQLTEYGIKVLLDAALSVGLVNKKDCRYLLTRLGHFILHDKMTGVNLEFTRDFCYRGLDGLKSSIESGKPEGLKEYTTGETLYPFLSELPEPAKSSWFKFDHFYSDKAFPKVMPILFEENINTLVDIGGNTGRFSRACAIYNDEVALTVVDLPEQISLMEQEVKAAGFDHRIAGHPANMLDENPNLPKGADIYWMSQFLDCFSEDEVVTILKNVKAAMNLNSRLYILELFWDEQRFEAASLSLNCISLYFTCFANGNSRMYSGKDFRIMVEMSGLKIEQCIDGLGGEHSLLICSADG